MEESLARIEILVQQQMYTVRVETGTESPKEYRHQDFEIALEQAWTELKEEFEHI